MPNQIARFIHIRNLLIFVAFFSLAANAQAQRPPDRDYLFYVVCESADKIDLIRFGPKGERIEREFETGAMPSDIDGPHCIAVSPDKKSFYVSLGHGRPFGSVWKYSTAANEVLEQVMLGMFPAKMDLSPDGSLLYIVNFNLPGDMVPFSFYTLGRNLICLCARA